VRTPHVEREEDVREARILADFYGLADVEGLLPPWERVSLTATTVETAEAYRRST